MMPYLDLSKYDQSWFMRGRSSIVIILWFLVQATLFRFSPHFGDGFRALLLRLFGAKIGAGLKVRPSVRITYPWRLDIGRNVWIGEEAYLHSLTNIKIGDNAVISQRSFLCTGSHDYRRLDFNLIVKPIHVECQAWVAAQAFIGPGVRVGVGAVIGAGSVVVKDVPPGSIWAGNPARCIGQRENANVER